jgi:hypothetical protein
MDDAIARIRKQEAEAGRAISNRSLVQKAHALFRQEEQDRLKERKAERHVERKRQAGLQAEWHSRLNTLVPLYRSIVTELAAINEDEAARREARRVKAIDQWVLRREQWEREVETAEKEKKASKLRDLRQAREAKKAKWSSESVGIPSRRNMELEKLWQDKPLANVASVTW